MPTGSPAFRWHASPNERDRRRCRYTGTSATRTSWSRWASDLLVVARGHPWTLDLPLARLPIGPNRSAWLDQSLQALADTALSEHEKAALVLLVNDYVFSQARFEAQLPDASAAGWRLLPRLVTAERYPALRRALDAGVFAGGGRDRDAAFRFGLDRILDGIESLAAQRTATPA